MVPAAPQLPAKALQRVRAKGRAAPNGGLRRWGQAAGVLVAAAMVAVVGIAVHQATLKRDRQGQAPVASPNFIVPTIVPKGPGAAIAWLDNLTGVDPNGHIVGRIPAQAALRSADGNVLYALAGKTVHVYSGTTGKLERTIGRTGSGDDTALSPDGRYLAIFGGTPPTVEMIDIAAGRSVASATLGGGVSNSGLGVLPLSADGCRVVGVRNIRR